MNLTEWSQIIQPAVDAEMRQVVYGCLGDHQEELRAMLAYHLSWEGPGAGVSGQGKRIRPLLLLLCTAACAVDWDAALPAAAAVELVHNFSLIHDDIEDRSFLRRGRQTVWAIWGVPLAINAGDTLFALANRSILRLSETIGAEIAVQATRLYLDTCVELTGGQHMDITAEDLSVIGLSEYIKLVSGKTAALISTSAELGAVAAGIGGERRTAFRRFGSGLGLAFQAQDDWLGVWGSEQETGKSAATDLLTGKKSLPVVFGLEQHGEFSRRWAKGAIQPEEVDDIRKLLVEEGAEEFTRLQVERWTEEARTALEEALAMQPGDAAGALHELVDVLLQRRS